MDKLRAAAALTTFAGLAMIFASIYLAAGIPATLGVLGVLLVAVGIAGASG